MGKIKIELIDCEYLEWIDNPGEMKRFCPECTITYETCAIEDFWSLKIYDCILEKERIVPLKEKVVKLSENNFCLIPDVIKCFGAITKLEND